MNRKAGVGFKRGSRDVLWTDVFLLGCSRSRFRGQMASLRKDALAQGDLNSMCFEVSRCLFLGTLGMVSGLPVTMQPSQLPWDQQQAPIRTKEGPSLPLAGTPVSELFTRNTVSECKRCSSEPSCAALLTPREPWLLFGNCIYLDFVRKRGRWNFTGV